MLEGETDEQLMGLVASGDQAAFRHLMTRHMHRAIRVAQGIAGSAAADDIAQEAFLRIWKKASSFDASLARFTTWMHRIVVNMAIDRARAQPAEPIEAAAEIADDRPGALAALIDDEERQAVHAALSAMNERQRAAITLFHFEGLSGRNSAQAMNLSESAFESLLNRARATLKENVQALLGGRGRKP